MLFIKKLVSRLCFPLPLGLELLVAGLVVEHFTRRKKLGGALIIAGAAWLAFAGYPWLPNALLPRLEKDYPPLATRPLQEANPRLIVVPGMGIHSLSNAPANLRFPDEFIMRLLEAVRIHRLLPGSHLLVSISNPELDVEEKQRVLAEFLGILGVDPQQASVVTGCRDTEEEMRAFQRQAGTNTVCLVSSGANLPRAMLLARRHGLKAVASPSSWHGPSRLAAGSAGFSVVNLFPSAEHLGATELAFYEYLGLTFEHLKSALGPAGH
jgi:uncharacterized SAM-binding protein YcdF (DUF218 family)